VRTSTLWWWQKAMAEAAALLESLKTVNSDQPTKPYVPPAQLAAQLDPPGLVEEAGARKRQANSLFERELYDPAMISYFVALWYLKVERPPYDEGLQGQQAPADREATKFLGDGSARERREAEADAEADDWKTTWVIFGALGLWLTALLTAVLNALRLSFSTIGGTVATIVFSSVGLFAYWRRETRRAAEAAAAAALAAEPRTVLNSPEALALRQTLHLNVAACAIKKADYHLAKVACEYVLKADAAHPKALYRLAQAYDGAGDTAKVQSTLAGLLKLEGQENNRDARKLLADVKSRRAREKAFFGGVVNKKGFCQSEEEAKGVDERSEFDKKHKPKSPLDARFDAYEEAQAKRTYGFKWEDIGTEPPEDGILLELPKLEEKLPERREFTFVELETFEVPLDITEAHYVKLGDKCIRAKGRDWVNPHEMVAKPPPGMNKDSDDEDDD